MVFASGDSNAEALRAWISAKALIETVRGSKMLRSGKNPLYIKLD